ncbi:hypothetical protein BLM37_04020 [Candidatus Gracilibacteria bacterium GN02-873]|nr:hypothetical protein BLM37_04020 [Candidatus Gracilibacteria bacterium GN02-873]
MFNNSIFSKIYFSIFSLKINKNSKFESLFYSKRPLLYGKFLYLQIILIGYQFWFQSAMSKFFKKNFANLIFFRIIPGLLWRP